MPYSRGDASHLPLLELENMNAEQQRIVVAGHVAAGTLPVGMSEADFATWIRERYAAIL